MTDLELLVRGRRHRGWKNVRIVRSIEQLASAFDVGFTDRWSRTDEPLGIFAGDECALEVDGDRIVSGYVDDAEVSSTASDRSMTVSGRSRAGDLVDASAVHKSGQWTSRPLREIATDLCKPFGVAVRAEVDLGGAIRTFALQEGESVYEALDRLARIRGLLVVTATDGAVVFTRAGKSGARTRLERGVNILRGTVRTSWRERFSEYIVKAQSSGDDSLFGEPAAAAKATAKDAGVGRHRPLIILSDEQGSVAELKQRAQWEANVRAGRASRLVYEVPGWRDAAGAIWEPNTRVQVIDPWFRVNAELLIVSATLARSDQGTTTELELADPKAFDVLPVTPKPKKDDDGIFGMISDVGEKVASVFK